MPTSIIITFFLHFPRSPMESSMLLTVAPSSTWTPARRNCTCSHQTFFYASNFQQHQMTDGRLPLQSHPFCLYPCISIPVFPLSLNFLPWKWLPLQNCNPFLTLELSIPVHFIPYFQLYCLSISPSSILKQIRCELCTEKKLFLVSFGMLRYS